MLTGRCIAVPESRQLDVLATLIEQRGGSVMRAPLVSIHDAPDPEPVLAWIRRFVERPPDLFILLTGEGLRRLHSLSEGHGLADDFVAALAGVRILCRGPKPGRALAELGLRHGEPVAAPTTEGVIETLGGFTLDGIRVAVQLYGEDLNTRLMDYLSSRGAIPDAVAPYIYADDVETQQVCDLINALASGEVDAITFTSQPQFRRLQQVAKQHGLEDALQQGMASTVIAAVGPVVGDQLQQAGFRVDIMPERTWFMKPLVTALMRHFSHEAGEDG